MNDPRIIANTTAVILTGGKSSRMGSDKALLQLAGRPLLRHAIELAGAVTENVKIVGDPAKYAAFGTVVADLYHDSGPLGGIHAALASTNSDLNVILATDLPFVEPEFLRYLLAIAKETTALVTVPQVGRYFEPLCAVYRKEFAEIAAAALNRNKNKVDALFTEPATRVVNEEEITVAGFSSAMFRNLNTPEEWQQANDRFVGL
jgi:molybdopterin-guanine dinucleotide biosynthesis protein A